MKYQNTTLEDFSLYSVEKDFDISKLDEISSLSDTVEGTKFNDVKDVKKVSQEARYTTQALQLFVLSQVFDNLNFSTDGNEVELLKAKNLFWVFGFF